MRALAVWRYVRHAERRCGAGDLAWAVRLGGAWALAGAELMVCHQRGGAAGHVWRKSCRAGASRAEGVIPNSSGRGTEKKRKEENKRIG